MTNKRTIERRPLSHRGWSGFRVPWRDRVWAWHGGGGRTCTDRLRRPERAHAQLRPTYE
ncbi:MAG: hypothetical protein AAF799_10800 [Myxococcota bacterium]